MCSSVCSDTVHAFIRICIYSYMCVQSRCTHTHNATRMHIRTHVSASVPVFEWRRECVFKHAYTSSYLCTHLCTHLDTYVW